MSLEGRINRIEDAVADLVACPCCEGRPVIEVVVGEQLPSDPPRCELCQRELDRIIVHTDAAPKEFDR